MNDIVVRLSRLLSATNCREKGGVNGMGEMSV